MRRIYLIGSVVMGLFGMTKVSQAQVITQTLSYTGALQTLTVPACVSQVTITSYGAQGVNGASTASGAIGGTAGLGAQVSGVFTFTSSPSVLNVYVGGAGTGSVGGFNGGGNGPTNSSAGAGGGASDVRLNGTALTDRIIVAGGGGGGGTAGCASSTITGGNGGAGGGGNGTAGFNSQAGGGGQGATGTTGGAPGIGCPLASGTVGANGTLGVGGDGGASVLICGSRPAGGGGGGGFNGGGGGGGGTAGTTSCTLNDTGAGGGGAGGTNYFASGFTNTTVTNGTRTGNGLVVISYSAQSTPTITAASQTLCTGKTATLTASGATTYTWSTSTTGNSVTVTPASSTSYTVTGTGAVAGCTASAVVNVTVNPTPTVGVVVSQSSVCSGGTVIVTGTGANTYTWTNSITNGVAFQPSTTVCSSVANVYTVTGTSALGCTNTAVATITVVTTPSVAPVTSTTQVCAGGGNTISITASCANAYTWTPGNFTTSAITVTPANTTTYTLVRDNGSGCTFTSNITLTVNALPGIIAVSASAAVCSGVSNTLTAGGAATYTWLPASVPTLTGSPVVVTQTATGVPSVKVYTVIGNNGTCTNVANVQFTVNPNPTVTIAGTSSVLCLNQSSTLTANSPTVSPVISYIWPSLTPIGTTSQVVVTPTTTSAFPIVVLNNFSCSATATQVVVVNPLPTVTAITSKTLVCLNNSVTLTGSLTGAAVTSATYSWSTGALTRTTNVTLSGTTNYTVTGTYTATGCKNTATVNVFVFTPTVTVIGPTATCYGGSITLQGSGATTYTWNGNYPFQNFTSSVLTTPTVFLVSGQTSSNNVSCISTASAGVAIFVNPTVTALSSPSAICANEISVLTGSGCSTYSWSDGQVVSPANVTPTIQTTYTVIGTDDNGCSDTTTVLVKVSKCTGLPKISGSGYDVVSIFPNPNNGEFIISSDIEIDLKLVNELGQFIRKVVLFNSNNNKVSVEDLPSGIYYLVGERDGTKVNQKIIVNK